MEKEELKRRCLEAIDANRDKIVALGTAIYQTPELGYKEFRSTETIANAFRELGYEPETGIAYTGCKISTGDKGTGRRIAIMGELDCVMCATHPDAAENGNVHACGHNIQVANMYGAAVGLLTSGVMDHLSGAVDFIAIPSEECVDYQYRNQLMQNGDIHFLGGKPEYLLRGGFDDVDMVLQHHVMEQAPGKRCILNTKSNGFITKTVRFLGKAAHAGSAPEEGINALNMAELALNNIHALRETFRDEDRVRVSMIIKNGGELVNVVPAEITAELMVRAFTVDAMLESSKKVNRAMHAAALALGGRVEIDDAIGYLPLCTDENLSEYYKQNMIQYAGAKEEEFVQMLETAISTDLGDISLQKPCMHIWGEGVTGGLHSEMYRIPDLDKAYLQPAKMMALQVIDLLYGDGAAAEEVVKNFHPSFDKASYLKLMQDNKKLDVFDATAL